MPGEGGREVRCIGCSLHAPTCPLAVRWAGRSEPVLGLRPHGVQVGNLLLANLGPHLPGRPYPGLALSVDFSLDTPLPAMDRGSDIRETALWVRPLAAVLIRIRGTVILVLITVICLSKYILVINWVCWIFKLAIPPLYLICLLCMLLACVIVCLCMCMCTRV